MLNARLAGGAALSHGPDPCADGERAASAQQSFAAGGGKLAYCRMRQAVANPALSRAFWHSRGQLLRGVCAEILGRKQEQLYGDDLR